MESLSGPNAGLTEVLIPAGYVTTVYDPVFKLNADRTAYVSAGSDKPTPLKAPGLPFSLVFRAEPGKEDVMLEIAAAYEAASKRRIPPPISARSRLRYWRLEPLCMPSWPGLTRPSTSCFIKGRRGCPA